MRIVIQRVSQASVSLNAPHTPSDVSRKTPDPLFPEEATLNEIAQGTTHTSGAGFMLLVGVSDTDTEKEAQWAAKKIANMRIFPDTEGKMNLSLLDTHGSILSISQFTLFGDIHKGNRPSFISAGEPVHAEQLWHVLNTLLAEEYSIRVAEGWFGADMAVSITNEGPTTILLDTDRDMPHKA